MPGSVGAEFMACLTPANLGIMIGTLVVWAGFHLFGIGELIDALLLIVGFFTIGGSVYDAAGKLYKFVDTTSHARSEDDLNRAAQALADAVVELGVTAIMAVLLHRSLKKLPGQLSTRIKTIRTTRPGLWRVSPDFQADALWRRATIRPNPNLPEGAGRTSAFGDIEYSTQGSATEVQKVRIHEMVHSILKPRLRVLRTFRVRMQLTSYWRSAVLHYLNEALAETTAQLMVDGTRGLLTGLWFPLANGYVTIAELAREGAAIGTVIVGTQRFVVTVKEVFPG
jgi:hypothetical protein